MKKLILYSLGLLAFLSACSHKEIKQGSITYNIEYHLPDSLNKYLAFLPKSATVYFKGDSAVTVQQANEEATTVITYKPTNFMRVLLSSAAKKYVIDYNKADQDEESPARLGYSYVADTAAKTVAENKTLKYSPSNKGKGEEADTATKVIAGHKTLKYLLTNKVTGESAEAWFTKELSVIPNSLTMAFDSTYGVPLAFTISQNGMLIKTTVKQIKFEPVPAGVFSVPPGYQRLTPKQLREMPVEN